MKVIDHIALSLFALATVILLLKDAWPFALVTTGLGIGYAVSISHLNDKRKL